MKKRKSEEILSRDIELLRVTPLLLPNNYSEKSLFKLLSVRSVVR
jgi:hypothetical protein